MPENRAPAQAAAAVAVAECQVGGRSEQCFERFGGRLGLSSGIEGADFYEIVCMASQMSCGEAQIVSLSNEVSIQKNLVLNVKAACGCPAKLC
ncbi:hypothetical protein D3C81_1958370 [compost metagenome]